MKKENFNDSYAIKREDAPKKRKGIIPKKQRRKQIKVKDNEKVIKKNKSTIIPHTNKENEEKNEVSTKNIENKKENNEKYKKNILNQGPIQAPNDMRFFGKEISNLTSLNERSNQYILKGDEYKKYFDNCILANITDDIFDFSKIENTKKPQYVLEFREEIFKTLILEENNNIPNYDKLNEIIPEDIRNRYILFLIQVCDKITKKEEIHYLSINIFDRVLISKNKENKNKLTEKNLQLICFTSLFIAYKYETGYYFLLDDLIKHTEDSLVTREEVLNYEYEINSILNFEYLIVYPSHFLKHYDLIDSIHNEKVYYFCLYLIDFILSDTKLMCYKKSLISASCYYIAKVNILKINLWSNYFQFITGYGKEQIKELAIKIIKEIKNSKNLNIFRCLKKKYSKDEYNNIIDFIMNKK